ncbi:MAG: hypothetical protein R8P61_06025 [Bacteroidia bacterium]|nr:hypothetical protein [Bacteroidia bacterium]
MKLLPFRQFIMLSNMDKRDVISHLSRNLQSREKVEIGDVAPPGREKKYEGFILGDTFSISPIELKDNFFKPVLEGFFWGNKRYTEIEVSMVFPLGIAACISLFAALLGFFLIFFLLEEGQRAQIDFLVLLIPILSLACLYLSCLLHFKRYSKKMRTFFKEVYEFEKLYERI